MECSNEKPIVRWIWYYPIIGTCVNKATGFPNDTNMTGGHRIYFNMLSKIVSQNYRRGQPVAKLETLCREVVMLIQMVVDIFSPVCTPGQLTLTFHFLNYLIKDVLSFGSLFALDASPYKRYITVFKAANRHESKRLASRMYETMFGLVHMETTPSLETSSRKNNFFKRGCNKTALRIEKGASC